MSDDNHNLPPNAETPPDDDHDHAQVVSIERAESLLKTGQIDYLHGATLWGSNYSALVTVQDDELKATAVYKPQRGERPLWDFPDGTLCYRETLAYTVSKVLDCYLVPPTVLRQGPHGLGSVQLFIEHNPEINYFNLGDSFMPQLQRFAVFDYLVNNTDRKGGHLLLDGHSKLWGIDHGLTFHALPKLRTVIWEFAGDTVADDLLEAVNQVGEQLENPETELRKQVNEWLRPAEITAMQQRIRHLLETKCYPIPGPGPNHPWPPV
ncbi:MAG: SCO1664 family protein [Anaerolineae bacterium]|nr:SCO1664 family protein [Anaerolineae bacterium]